MSKGLRLSYCGTTCTATEVMVIAHALGFNTYPRYNGWGKDGGYRNFFGCNSNNNDDKDFIACENLVKKEMMYVENGKSWSVSDRIFHVTKKGKDWFSHFRRNHHHADWDAVCLKSK